LLWVLVGAVGSVIGGTSKEQSLQVQTVFESAAGQSLAAGQVVIVKPGDTLWSIARKLQPTGDIRPLVDRIAKINNGHSLIAGQALVLP
jgi:LysM repeat protein